MRALANALSHSQIWLAESTAREAAAGSGELKQVSEGIDRLRKLCRLCASLQGVPGCPAAAEAHPAECGGPLATAWSTAADDGPSAFGCSSTGECASCCCR